MKAHKNKIRATFYIDKKLYQLMKRCSYIESIPMSSIINDDILKRRVGKYELDTPEHVNEYDREEAEEAEELNQELSYEAYEKSPSGQRDSQLHKIDLKLKQKIISESEAQKQRLEAEVKYEKDLEIEAAEEARRKKELYEKWVKAVTEIPIE